MKIVVCKTPRILAGFLRLFFGIITVIKCMENVS